MPLAKMVDMDTLQVVALVALTVALILHLFGVKAALVEQAHFLLVVQEAHEALQVLVKKT